MLQDNGFSVLFDVESFDYGYYDEGSEGLKVELQWQLILFPILHLPNYQPMMLHQRDGFPRPICFILYNIGFGSPIGKVKFPSNFPVK